MGRGHLESQSSRISKRIIQCTSSEVSQRCVHTPHSGSDRGEEKFRFQQPLTAAAHPRYCYSIYWSRALVVPMDSQGNPKAHNQALCPYLDLLNHCPRSAHTLSATASAPGAQPVIELKAGSDVASGSEVVINYGRKSNEQLFLCVLSRIMPWLDVHRTREMFS